MGWKQLAWSGSVTVTALLITTGCGSDDSAICVSNEAGEVCADSSDGAIRFNGRGLEPGSDVRIEHVELGQSTYRVGVDGTFDPDGSGVLSLFAGTEFTFAVSATATNGASIEGDITITT